MGDEVGEHTTSTSERFSWASQSLGLQVGRTIDAICNCTRNADTQRGARTRSREVEARILAGQTALRSIRLRVSGTMLFLGIGCVGLAQLGYHSDELDEDGPEDGASWVASVSCMVFLAVAPLPDDWLLTLVVLLINAVIAGVDLVWNLEALFIISRRSDGSSYEDGCEHPALNHPRVYCIWKASLYIAYIFFGFAFCLGNFLVIFQVVRARCLRLSHGYMWSCLAAYFGGMAVVDGVMWIALTVLIGQFAVDGPLWYLPGDVLGFLACALSHFRHKFHVVLRAMFYRTESTAAAAGIASLVGNCDPRAVQRKASERFCSISLAQLTYADLETNSPSMDQAPLAMPTKLGSCDAFISHSWHDCAMTKWDALQAWRQVFVSRNSRDPSVWLDKCCIDQCNIDADLRCLPVFLSGCQKMVVLCGVTYLSRLWCIMELFTYVHMGGDPNAIELHLLLRAGRRIEDRCAISTLIESFDAGMCTCANDADRDRMLEIIRTAYGDIREFNQAVRRIIETTCARYVEYADLVSSSSSDGEEGSTVESCPTSLFSC